MQVENGDWLWAIGGHSGVDVYAQDSSTAGAWRWAASSGNNNGYPMSVAAIDQGKSRIKNFTMVIGGPRGEPLAEGLKP